MLLDELMCAIFNGWSKAPVAGPIMASGPTTRGSKEIFFMVTCVKKERTRRFHQPKAAKRHGMSALERSHRIALGSCVKSER